MSKKIIIPLLFVFVSKIVVAQHYNYSASVDAKTYQLYQQSNWVELIKEGKKAQKDSINFYYLEVRLGVAYFYDKLYINAKKQFKNSRKVYAENLVVNELLFWCDYNLGNKYEADLDLQYLPDSIVKRINIKPLKSDNFIYNEAGVKLASDNTINATYFNSVLSIRPTKRINWINSYTNLQQTKPWGNYTEHQYYTSIYFQVNEKIKFSVSYHPVWNTSNIAQTKYDNITTYQFEDSDNFGTYNVTATDSLYSKNLGNLTQQAALYSFSMIAKYNRITIMPQITVFTEKIAKQTTYQDTINSSYDYYSQIDSSLLASFYKTNDTSYVSTFDTTTIQYQPSLFLGYTPSLFHNKLSIGANFVLPISNAKISLLIEPSINFRFLPNLYVNASYFSKKGYFYSQNNGSIIYNSNDEIKKISLTINYLFLKHFGIHCTYQNEQIIDVFNQSDYNLHSYLVGLKINL